MGVGVLFRPCSDIKYKFFLALEAITYNIRLALSSLFDSLECGTYPSNSPKDITVSNYAPFTPWFVEIVIPFFC